MDTRPSDAPRLQGGSGPQVRGQRAGQPGEPPREMIAIEVASIDLAHALRSAWEATGGCPSIEMRVLQLHALPSAEFPLRSFPEAEGLTWIV